MSNEVEEDYDEEFLEDNAYDEEEFVEVEDHKPSAEILRVAEMVRQQNQQLKVSLEPEFDLISPRFNRIKQQQDDLPPVRAYIPPKPSRNMSEEQKAEEVKRLQRVKKLKHSITLTEEAFDIFDMNPLGSYDVYQNEIRTRVRAETGVQVNEDWMSQEVQTEQADTQEVGLQVPEDHSSVVATADRLVRFLRQSSQAIETLLLESSSNLLQPSNDARGLISHTACSLKLPAFLGERAVRSVNFCSARSNLLLVAYGPPEGPGSKAPTQEASNEELEAAGLKNYPMNIPRKVTRGQEKWLEEGVLAVWDANRPQAPLHVLYCDGTPECCTFGPDTTHLCFAGLEDGSLACWDLRETRGLRYNPSVTMHEGLSLRSPAFTTTGPTDENHCSAVVALAPLDIGRHDSKPDLTALTMAATRKEAFQLMSLDEQGAAFIWTVVELQEIDLAGSESDLGMGIGARVKLIKTGAIYDPDRVPGFNSVVLNPSMRPHAFAVAFFPFQTSEALAAVEDGYIDRVNRLSISPSPASYSLTGGRTKSRARQLVRRANVDKRASGKVTEIKQDDSSDPHPQAKRDPCQALAFSPYFDQYYLAGYRSGTIALYHIASSLPRAAWPQSCPAPVIALQWSTFRPSVFFAVDASGNVHCWDLLLSEHAPVHSAKVFDPTGLSARPSVLTPWVALSYNTSNSRNIGLLACANSSGKAVDVHVLNKEVTRPDEKSLARVRDLLASMH